MTCKSFVLLSVTLLLLTGTARAQQWSWATAFGGKQAKGMGMATDKWGNFYVCGSYYDTLGIETIRLTGPNVTEAFVAKFSPNHDLLWARTSKCTYETIASAVGTDDSGNVYIAGAFEDSTSFGHIPLRSRGSHDIFLAKYDRNGNVQWAQRGGGVYDDFLGSRVNGGMAAGKNGTVYITGTFGYGTFQGAPVDTADFGSMKLPCAGEYNMFTVQYNSSGQVQWADGNSLSQSDMVNDIAVDEMDNAYVTGNFNRSIQSFGSYQLSRKSAGPVDGNIFLLKYTGTGSIAWAKSIGIYRPAGGGGQFMGRSAVSLDTFGNAYLVTSYIHSDLLVEQDTLPSNGQPTSLGMIKYDPDGQLIWAKRSPAALASRTRSAAVDRSGALYTMGTRFITANANVDSGSFYVAKWNTNGDLAWTITADSVDEANDLTVDNAGQVYVTGNLYNVGYFGNHLLHNTSYQPFPSALYTVPFVAGIEQPSLTITAPVTKTGTMLAYPNPAPGSFRIKISGQQQYTRLSVVDESGRTIYTKQIAAGETELQVSPGPVANGIYYIVCDGNGTTVGQKIMIAE